VRKERKKKKVSWQSNNLPKRMTIKSIIEGELKREEK
jgi:hypothetical protein